MLLSTQYSPYPLYTTFFHPPPHIPIIISRTAIHLLLTSCRMSQSSLLVRIRSGMHGSTLYANAQARPVECSIACLLQGRRISKKHIAVLRRGGTCSTVTRTSDVHERQIRSHVLYHPKSASVCVCVLQPTLRNCPLYRPFTFDQRHNFHMHPVVNTSTTVPTCQSTRPLTPQFPRPKTRLLRARLTIRLHRLFTLIATEQTFCLAYTPANTF